MERVVLKASRRDVTGKKVGALRRAGKLPGVLYGHGIGSTPIMLDAHETWLKLSGLTSSTLVTLDLDGRQYLTLLRDRQRDCIRNRLLHLDFQALSRSEKIRTKVGIEITGESPAVRDSDATLAQGLTELEVESLPQDLPERITVDISGLAKAGDSIRVCDLSLSDKLTVLNDPGTMIVSVVGGKREVVGETAAEEAVAVGEAAQEGRTN